MPPQPAINELPRAIVGQFDRPTTAPRRPSSAHSPKAAAGDMPVLAVTAELLEHCLKGQRRQAQNELARPSSWPGLTAGAWRLDYYSLCTARNPRAPGPVPPGSFACPVCLAVRSYKVEPPRRGFFLIRAERRRRRCRPLKAGQGRNVRIGKRSCFAISI